ncbi:helix-turn-helix transcriptional regulator [Flavivirga abyssicola]|uniref:helix-turn-helix domain-containing protein n=1 Tax=Flavivirga abyssicola TaxID=3063533 RepID=UPI0026DF9B05|nr:helix-turn-helix transcriptional regulator [Flavivirga sp. MEBiC07777]WVK11771.1 helix-turn-helix transcriptional regulator [Flavivirga sp. MEBiC07777]
MVFEEKLKQLIKSKYVKLSDLAEKFGMNYSQLSQYVNGKKVSIDFLNKIIQEFPEADLNWLLRNDDILNESRPPYKVPLTNNQIIDKIEVLLADLKGQIEEEK